MRIDDKKLVTVFGGSGFLGRYVVHALAARGHRIRVACRRPDLAYHLQTAGRLGQIQPIQANLRYPWSVERAVEDADHVVNLVGILTEAGKQRYTSVQAEGAKLVAEAAARRGLGMVQLSAIGADESSASQYARTKAQGERSVLQAVPDAVILRPSIVFGAEDQFFNRFADMARLSPVLPLIGGGKTLFQPVYVNDVAQAVAAAVEGAVPGGRIYELGGPEALSFRKLMEEMLLVIDRKRRFLTIPFGAAEQLAGVLKYLPGAPLTPDQVEQLKHDNVVSEAAKAEGRTFDAFGIRPRTLEAVLPTYLVRFRPQGQFTKGSPTSDQTVDPEIAPRP
ncbi:complex I NDUFA9 subunit family protein [Aureimonas frigidaquae]|uniref:NADH-ubiquinone oxidoreductase n=1 Tax=Aureimonas frigidaquae TaxID=424757 RepID=A0A0P0Z0E6_9HYPH|nr:complex I NDUFA9 subunit family protein [Aureimonas frigidaquae]BAT27366.1 NADH-ubiquinone oxidoreductase [Aureimonas frigidaquae]